MTRQFARGLLCYLCVVFQNVYSDSPQPLAFVHLVYIMHLYRIYSIFPNLFLKYFRILSACSLGIPADPLGIHKKLQKSLLLLNFAREKPEQNPEKFTPSKLACEVFHKGRRKLHLVNKYPSASLPPVFVQKFTNFR